MSQSIKDQWNAAAVPWTEFVRNNKDFYRDEMNNPAMFRLLGDIKSKKVLDIGCGEGFNTRLLAEKGASVVGVDFSEEMIKLAIAEEDKRKQGIEYYVADACNLNVFEDGSFEIVTAFFAIQDIEDYVGAIKEVARVLRPDGRFVFSITHPCFEVRMVKDRIISGWIYDTNKKKGEEEKVIYSRAGESPKYFAVDEYFNRTIERVPWTMERMTEQFETTAFHRTLSDYVTTLTKAGLLISNLDEPVPSEKGIELHPVMKENTRIPHSLIVEAVKR
jgi:ubiquinone/menaquinone biosynthesis C-methylase UbiE